MLCDVDHNGWVLESVLWWQGRQGGVIVFVIVPVIILDIFIVVVGWQIIYQTHVD